MLFVLIVLLFLVIFFVYNRNVMENFLCCDHNNQFKNMFINKKPFENEHRFGNILSYELNE